MIFIGPVGQANSNVAPLEGFVWTDNLDVASDRFSFSSRVILLFRIWLGWSQSDRVYFCQLGFVFHWRLHGQISFVKARCFLQHLGPWLLSFDWHHLYGSVVPWQSILLCIFLPIFLSPCRLVLWWLHGGCPSDAQCFPFATPSQHMGLSSSLLTNVWLASSPPNSFHLPTLLHITFVPN